MTDRDDGDCAGSLLDDGLSGVGRELAVAGFTAIWAHQALRPDQLLPTQPLAARECAERLATAGRAELDDHGRLVGIHGLTLHPGRHRVGHAGQAHFTWCAFDAVGIPAALELDAAAETDCPACGRPLVVEFQGGKLTTTSDLVVWLPATDPTADLRASFCAKADTYCSAEHLREVIDPATTPGTVTELAAAVDLGRTTWSDVAIEPSAGQPTPW